MDLLRGTPAPLLAEISKPFFFPVVLVFFDWPSAPIYAHSGIGSINYAGQTWTGVGKFGSISIPNEAFGGVVPSEMTMTLMSDYSEIEAYTGANIRGRAGRVYVGATTEPGGDTLIGAVEIFSGRGNGFGFTAETQDNEDEIITLYGLEVSLKVGPNARTPTTMLHSLEDQQRTYPNDTAGRHLILIEANVEKLLWPAP